MTVVALTMIAGGGYILYTEAVSPSSLSRFLVSSILIIRISGTNIITKYCRIFNYIRNNIFLTIFKANPPSIVIILYRIIRV